jgi:transcriptional/translational regulatory protein YebC/TACO1
VRTVAEVRHALSKHGGNLGTSGSVAFQFSRTGQISLPASAADEDTVMEAALDAGAEDVFTEDQQIVVLCPPDAVDALEQALKGKGLPVDRAEVAMRPANRSAVSGEAAETLQDLLDWLDELDDVQDVFHNAAFT